jgi:hypothetical protein
MIDAFGKSSGSASANRSTGCRAPRSLRGTERPGDPQLWTPSCLRGACARMSPNEGVTMNILDLTNDKAKVDYQLVQRKAYELWQRRGCPAGNPEHDWFEAVRQLAREAQSKTQATARAGKNDDVASLRSEVRDLAAEVQGSPSTPLSTAATTSPPHAPDESAPSRQVSPSGAPTEGAPIQGKGSKNGRGRKAGRG